MSFLSTVFVFFQTRWLHAPFRGWTGIHRLYFLCFA